MAFASSFKLVAFSSAFAPKRLRTSTMARDKAACLRSFAASSNSVGCTLSTGIRSASAMFTRRMESSGVTRAR